MRAANLMPEDGGRRGPKVALRSNTRPRRTREPKEPRRPREPSTRVASGSRIGPALILAAILFGVLIITAAAVLAHNTVKDRQATLSAVQARVSAEQVAVARLSNKGKVITNEIQMASMIQTITGSRFNWYSAMTGFGEVISPHTYFTSLTYNGTGTAAATSATAGSSGPQFSLGGCTGSQDDVAGVLRQLRQIRGVLSVSESTGETGTQLGNSSRSGTSKRARSGLPSRCSDTFLMSILFVPPTIGNEGR